jgi:hypothetical protein
MNAVVADRLMGLSQFRIPTKTMAGIGVTVEAGEVGGRHLDADAVPFSEDIARHATSISYS